MRNDWTLSGTLGQCEHPNWEPLLDRVGELLTGRFMWMTEIELEDGTVLHAYKDQFTRRYLHLTEDGRTFYYTAEGRYAETDLETMLMAVYYDDVTPADALSPEEELAVHAAIEKLRAEQDAA